MQIINTCIHAGIWQGDLVGGGAEAPSVVVTHQGQALEQVACTRDAAQDVWHITAPIPATLLNDGVQTFVVGSSEGHTYGKFSLVCGAPLEEDLLAEIALLRSELDLLKTAFRKHCAEK